MFFSECTELKDKSFEARPQESSAGVFEGMGDVMTKEVTADEVASAVAAASDDIEDMLMLEELGDIDRAKRIGVKLADFSAELGMLAGLTDEEHQKAGFSSIFDIALGSGSRGSNTSSSSSWSGEQDRKRSRPLRHKRAQNEGAKRQAHANSDVSDEGATGDERDVWTTDQSATSDASTPKDSEICDILQPKAEFVLPLAEKEANESANTPSARDHLLKILAENGCDYFAKDGRELNADFAKFNSEEEAISRYLEPNPLPVTPEEEAILLTHVCEWRSKGSDSTAAAGATPSSTQEAPSGGERCALRLIQAVEDVVAQNLPDNPEWKYSISLCCSCTLCAWITEELEQTMRDIVTRLALEPSTTRDALTVLTESSFDPKCAQARAACNLKLSEKGADVLSECLTRCGEAATRVCVCRPRHNASIYRHWAVDALVCMLQRYRESLFFYKLEVIGPDVDIGWLRRTSNLQLMPPDEGFDASEPVSCDCLRPTILTMEQLLVSSRIYKQSMLAWEKYEKLTGSSTIAVSNRNEEVNTKEIARIEEDPTSPQSDGGGTSDGSWTSSSSLGTKDTLARLVKSLAAIEQLVDRLATCSDRVGVARSLSELEAFLLAISAKLPALTTRGAVQKGPSSFQEFSSWIEAYTGGSSRRDWMAPPKARSRRRPRARPHLRARRTRYYARNLHKKLSTLEPDDVDDGRAEAKPPKTFVYSEQGTASDADTVVADENRELCKEMKECLSRFANFVINSEEKAESCPSPPLEMSNESIAPAPQTLEDEKFQAVSRLLTKTTAMLDTLKDHLGKGDIKDLTPMELGINLANTKRISMLLKDLGDIKQDMQKINDLSGVGGKLVLDADPREAVPTEDPGVHKYLTFGVEIKRAIDDCQSIIDTCNKYIESAKASDSLEIASKECLSLDQIYEAILNLDSGTQEALDAGDKTRVTEVVGNVPQMVAGGVSEIAAKPSEFGNGGGAELPEFASIMSSLPEIDNQNQLTPETLKQIRELKIAKSKGDTKISKSMKRKVARKAQVEPQAGAADGGVAEREDGDADAASNANAAQQGGVDNTLFSMSAHALTRTVFEYIKQSNKPELLSLLTDHGAHVKMEQEQDKRFYERCMEDVMRTNSTSLDDVRKVFAKRISLWRRRMHDKHKDIPGELLRAEIEDRTNKLFAYLNEVVEKCGRRILEKQTETKKPLSICEAAKSQEAKDRENAILTMGDATQVMSATLEQAVQSSMDYFDIMSRHAESAKLARILFASPEDALYCIAQIQHLPFQKRRLPPEYETASNEQKISYVLKRISELDATFVASLPRDNFTPDDWLYILYRLDLTQARLHNALQRVVAPSPPVIEVIPASGEGWGRRPAAAVHATTGEQVVAKGLSMMISRASQESGSKVHNASEPAESESERRAPDVCQTAPQQQHPPPPQAPTTVNRNHTSEESRNLLKYYMDLAPESERGFNTTIRALRDVLHEPGAGDAIINDNEQRRDNETSTRDDKADRNLDSNKSPCGALQQQQAGSAQASNALRAKTAPQPKTCDFGSSGGGGASGVKHVCNVNQTSATQPATANNAPPATTCLGSSPSACGECRSGDPPCNCCYCTVFGHAPPQTTPVPKNFNETRERLRSILNRKKQLTKEEEIAERRQVHQMLTQTLIPQQQHVKLPPKVMHKMQQPTPSSAVQAPALQQAQQQQQQQQQQPAPQLQRTQLQTAAAAAAQQQNAADMPHVHVRTNPPKPQSAATPIMKAATTPAAKAASGVAVNNNNNNGGGNVAALNNANGVASQQKMQVPLKALAWPPAAVAQQQQQQLAKANQQQTDPKVVRECGPGNPYCFESRDSSLESTSSGYSHRWIEDPRSLDDLLVYIEGPSRPTKAKKQAKKARQRAKKVEAGLLDWRAELEGQAFATRAALAQSRTTLAEVNARANALKKQHSNQGHGKKGKKAKANKVQEAEALLNKEMKAARALVHETETYLSDLTEAIETCNGQLAEVRQQMKLADSFAENKNNLELSLKQVAVNATKLKKPELVKNLPEQLKQKLQCKDEEIAVAAPTAVPKAELPKATVKQQGKTTQAAPQVKEPVKQVTPPCGKKEHSEASSGVAEVTLTKKQKKQLARKQAEEARLAEEKRRKEEEKAQKQKKNKKETKTTIVNTAATKQQQKQSLNGTAGVAHAHASVKADANAGVWQGKAPKKQNATAAPTAVKKPSKADKNAKVQTQPATTTSDGCSIMHQLSCGVQVGDLRLPPGITLTRVDPSCKSSPPAAPSIPNTQINAVPIWNRPTPPVAPQAVLMVSSPGEQPKAMVAEPPPIASAAATAAPKSKKAKKKAKKAAASVTDQRHDAAGTKMVTLRNPMFHPNLPPVQITTQSAVNSGAKKVPEHIRIPEPIPMPRGACQATITPTSNGMYTIRNPMVAAAHRQSPSYPASYVVTAPAQQPQPPQQQQPTQQQQQIHQPVVTVTGGGHHGGQQSSAVTPPMMVAAQVVNGGYNPMGAFARSNEGYSLFHQPPEVTSCAPPAPIAPPPLPDPIGPPPGKKCEPSRPAQSVYRDNGQYSLFEDSLPYFQRLRAHKEQIRPDASEQCSFGGAWSFEHSRQMQQQQQQQQNATSIACGNSSVAGSSLYTHTDHLNLFTDGFGGLSEMIKKSPVSGVNGPPNSSSNIFGAIGPRSNGLPGNLSDSGVFTSGSERDIHCPWEMYLNTGVEK